jgi:redox-regulated HSP33 family molecular chaperone
MFNGGQLVQEKLRLTNTADAVAYSAGVFEARMLNYDAYTNRAIIANQIAIGQAVGLASWAKYMGTSAATIRPYLYLIPVVGAALAEAMDYFESAMETLTPALAVAVTRHDAAIQALALSQQLMPGRRRDRGQPSRPDAARRQQQRPAGRRRPTADRRRLHRLHPRLRHARRPSPHGHAGR